MNTSEFFNLVSNTFSQVENRIFLESLHLDSYLWEAVQDVAFFKKNIEKNGNLLVNWSLGKIALSLVNIHEDILYKSIYEKPYLKKSIQIYDAVRASGEIIADGCEPVYLALALLERFNKLQKWDGIYYEINSHAKRNRFEVYQKWRTPFAIVYQWLPNPDDLIKTLLTEMDAFLAISIINHMVSTQLTGKKEKVRTLRRHIEQCSSDNQLVWNQLISSQISFLKKEFAASMRELTVLQLKPVSELVNDYSILTDTLTKNLYYALANMMDDSCAQANSYLHSAKLILNDLLVSVNLLSAQNDLVESDLDFSINPMLQDVVFLREEKNNQPDNAFEVKGLVVQLKECLEIKEKGEIVLAKEMGGRLFQQWFGLRKKNWPAFNEIAYLQGLQHEKLLQLLFDLNLYDCVRDYINFLDMTQLSLVPKKRLEFFEKNIKKFSPDLYTGLKLILVHDPEDPFAWNSLLLLLENENDWENLYEELGKKEGERTLNSVERVLFARSAMESSHFESAKHNCKQLLEEDYELGEVYAILGGVYLKENDYELAKENLEQAIKISPENSNAWLLLSSIHQIEGNDEEALSILRSSVLAAPDSPDIYFSLSQFCLKKDLYSEAYPYLKKALSLDSENPKYQIELIKILKTLGREDEATQLLEKARLTWPENSDLAYLAALNFIDINDTEAALNTLEIAITKRTAAPYEWYLLYVKILLKDNPYQLLISDSNNLGYSQLIQAQKYLQIGLRNNTKDPIGQELLAEVFYLAGEYEAAHSIYSTLVNQIKDNSECIEIKWKILAGLGFSKIALGEVESGLVVLHDATQANQKHLGIKHRLAESYYAIGLNEDATRIANDAFASAGTNVGNLIWYANFMETMGRNEEVVRALEQALHFAYDDASLQIRLAGEYISLGKQSEAFQALISLKDNPKATAQNHRQAAIEFLRLSRPDAALDFFRRTLDMQEKTPSFYENVELIYLFMQNGEWEQAIHRITQIILEKPNLSVLYVVEAECFLGLEDNIAALTALEHAVAVREKIAMDILPTGFLVPQDWIQKYEQIDSVYLQIAEIVYEQKDINRCIQFVEMASKQNPENIQYKVILTDLALQLLDYDQVNQYLLTISNQLINYTESSIIFSLVSGMDYVQSYFCGREIKNFINKNDAGYPVSDLLQVLWLLDKNQFNQASVLIKELSTVDSTITNLQISEKYPALLKRAQTNIIYRLIVLAYMRMVQYPEAEEFLDRWEAQSLVNFETKFYRYVLKLEQTNLQNIYLELGLSAKRYTLKQTMPLDVILDQLNSYAEKLGKSKIISQFETIQNALFSGNIARAQSLLYSLQIPRGFKYPLADFLMRNQAGSSVEQYLATFDGTIIDRLVFSYHQKEKFGHLAIASLENISFLDHPVINAMISKCYESIDNLDEAVAYAQKALLIWPNETNWLVRYASLLEKKGLIDLALEQWNLIVECSENKEQVIYTYFSLLIKLQEYQLILEKLDKYKKQLYGSYNYYFAYLQASYGLKAYDQALRAASAAKKVNPDKKEVILIEGKIYYETQHLERAKQNAEAVLQSEPENEEAYLLLTAVLEENGMFNEALNVVNKGIEHCPDSIQLYINKVWILRSAGFTTEALALASQLSVNHPDQGEIIGCLAILYNDLNDLKSAEETARKALKVNPDQAEIQLLLGKIIKKHGHLDQALNFFVKASNQTTESSEPWLEMGEIYEDQEDLSKAMESYHMAIKANAKDYRAYLKVGMLLKEIKDYQGAEQMLHMAVELNPKDANIRRQLAGVTALSFVHSPKEAK
ncbi:MAG: hypothetical protein CVU39_02545 [Chloroflexi bacterium HGW-Chloroflexi-10]|nr:MAG: hypothetical protein CVU39_02545 [Chloroflexi bacterium HGW-Chloroflexi-10]